MFGRKAFILGNGTITENNYKKATVIGNAEIFGGSIKKLTSIGNSTISGVLDSNKTNSVGNICASENMNVKLLKISGEGSFKKLSAENLISWGKLSNNGCSTLKGEISACTFEVMGRCTVKCNLKVENIFVSGLLCMERELQCENLECLGSIEAPAINAGHIYIYPRETSKLNELYASVVIIKRAFRECLKIRKYHSTWRHMSRRFKQVNSIINIETIEADKIYLENTRAKLVSGKNVIIGPGCSIETVEYIENLQIDTSSQVIKSVKI